MTDVNFCSNRLFEGENDKSYSLINRMLEKDCIYVYQRPDLKWSIFSMIKFGMVANDSRRTCWIETFGEPAAQRFSGSDDELQKISLWKRTLFQIFEDRVLEIKPELLRKDFPAITRREKFFPNVPAAFDSSHLFWIDI